MAEQVEVVYMRYFVPHVSEQETVAGALSFIEYGEDSAGMSSVGVFVNGEPRIWDGYVTKDAPTEEQAAEMRKKYSEALA